MKRKTSIGAAAMVIAAAGTGVAVKATADGGKKARSGSGAAMTTAAVERGDLSDTTSEQGTLGYRGLHKLKAGAAGAVTWVKAPGSRVRRDSKLYELNGRPVWLMYGTRPMYRTLKTGDKGRDVRQLEKNLSALGYGSGMTVDEKLTLATADAIKRWQRAHDRKATGTVGPDEIVFAPGPVRIKSRDATAGDRVAPGGQVVTASGAERVVNLKLEVAQASQLKKGTEVTVELPGGRTATGTVRTVGTTASKGGGENGDGGGEDEAKVNIVIELDDLSKAGRLDQAPVTVNLTTQTSEDVLSVPVQALLALPGGGYGVRVASGGAPRTVKVELGVFGEGRVEVNGDGLSEGLLVEVPKS